MIEVSEECLEKLCFSALIGMELDLIEKIKVQENHIQKKRSKIIMVAYTKNMQDILTKCLPICYKVMNEEQVDGFKTRIKDMLDKL